MPVPQVDVKAQTLNAVIISQVTYDVGGTVWLDGIVQNPVSNDSNVKDVEVLVMWDGSHPGQDWQHPEAECWVSRPGDKAAFAIALVQPAESAGYTLGVMSVPTAKDRVGLQVEFLESGPGTGGERWRRYRVTNTNAFRVIGPMLSAWEYERPPAGSDQLLDVMEPEGDFPAELAPGASFEVYMWGYNQPALGNTISAEEQGEALAVPRTMPVYRFYNRRTGTHFYTADPNERDSVLANLGHIYTFDGQCYSAYVDGDFGARYLSRFYNMRTGTHFYTTDPAEMANVIVNLSWLYADEGFAYFVADGSLSGTQLVYRFYNTRAGVHFYTADPNERDSVIASLGWLYIYEGSAYYVPK